MFSYTTEGTELNFQVTRCDGRSGTGSYLRTLGRITILLINLSIAERGRGGFKAALMRIGNLLVQVPFYGLMENVSILRTDLLLELMVTTFSWGRKERHLVR